jgi:hypothetical protein
MVRVSYRGNLDVLEASMTKSRNISHAQRLRLSLFLAAGLGAAVGCADKDDEDDSAGSATSGGEGGEGGEGGDGGDDGGSGSELTAVPEADYPVCSGGDTGLGGFEGPCCVDVYCIDAATDGSCPSTTETNSSEITGIGLGSGSCECEAPAGPYAPYDGKPGDCCYTVGVQGCEGRPLIIAGNLRTAPLQRGHSWRGA